MAATLSAQYIAMTNRFQFLARGMIVVMLITWIASFYPFDDLLDRQGTPLGADFSMFYAAGKVVTSGEGERLYDQAEHQRQLHSIFPQLRADFCLPYRYPPLVAWLMAPLSFLPYWLAYLLFFSVSLAIWLLVIRALRSALREEWPSRDNETDASAWNNNSIWFSVAAWPVALETLLGGQASMFGLAIAVTSLLLVRRQRYILAGAVLAFAAYKPNVLALFAVGLVCRYPRILLGIVPVATMLGVVTCWLSGWTTTAEYLALLSQLSGSSWDVATPFWKVQGIEPWIALVTPERSRVLTVAFGLVLSVTIGIAARFRKATDSVVFGELAAALLVINALFNPYTPIYDLVLLAPAFVFGGARFRHLRPRAIQAVIGTAFFGPHLSQALAKWIGLQLLPIVGLIALAAMKRTKRT